MITCEQLFLLSSLSELRKRTPQPTDWHRYIRQDYLNVKDGALDSTELILREIISVKCSFQ